MAAEKPDIALLRQAVLTVFGDGIDITPVHGTKRGGVARIVREDRALAFKLMTCNMSWKKRLARRFGWSPARRALRVSDQLAAAGFEIFPVERHGTVRLPGAPLAVWSLGPWFDENQSLRRLKKQLQGEHHYAPTHERVAALFRASLELLRRLHEAGFEHRDYHLGNLVVQGERLVLCDLETIRRCRVNMKGRAKDVERFLENFVEQGRAREQIVDALKAYAPDDTAMRESILAHPRLQNLITRIEAGVRKKRQMK